MDTSSAQATVNTALTTKPEFYTEGWLIYIGLAAVVLVIAHIVMRRWPSWIRLPIWSLMAAGALTPAASVADQGLWAPAIVVAVFGLEKGGVGGAASGLVPIALVFAALLLLMTLTQIIAWIRFRFGKPEIPQGATARVAKDMEPAETKSQARKRDEEPAKPERKSQRTEPRL